jgi:hypothetical protein
MLKVSCIYPLIFHPLYSTSTLERVLAGLSQN